jgi:hypothetical protein
MNDAGIGIEDLQCKSHRYCVHIEHQAETRSSIWLSWTGAGIFSAGRQCGGSNGSLHSKPET